MVLLLFKLFWERIGKMCISFLSQLCDLIKACLNNVDSDNCLAICEGTFKNFIDYYPRWEMHETEVQFKIPMEKGEENYLHPPIT